jgi:hypothetical protein
MNPPPLPGPQKRRSSNTTLWIVLGVVAAVVALGSAIFLAILIPTVGKVRDTARRALDHAYLRQILQASLIWSSDHDGNLPPAHLDLDGNPDTPKEATIQAVAAALARDGGLNDQSMWFSLTDPHGGADTVAAAQDRRVWSETHGLDPAFARQGAFAWDYATGLSLSLPSTTPVAWTRGLRTDGTWDPATAVYRGDGGWIAFLGGNVQFFRDLRSTPLMRADGKETSNILETLPPDALIVGAGPGTLNGTHGRGPAATP